jgi:predicted dehydrogenase
MATNKVIIIGFGHHARRIYFPILTSLKEASNVEIVGIVDLKAQKNVILSFLEANNANIPALFVKNNENDEKFVTEFADTVNANCVVISTGPEKHIDYASWAIKKGLHVLMDKPIHAESQSAHSVPSARKIHENYYSLVRLLEAARKKTPKLVCEVMTQRRHHPAYKMIRDIIEEVYEKTSCPITYYYGFHNDGQWRLPSELRDIAYHGYQDGNGKASHSGYHFYDLLNWFTEVYFTDKNIDKLKVRSWPNFTTNYMTQINQKVLQKSFPTTDFDKFPDSSVMDKYGEIDVMSTVQLISDKNVVTHAQIDLLHSGFSSRSWPSVDNRDLYKNNGRVRHEQHYINMGPFLSISLTSWQSKPFQSEDIDSERIFDPGHEYHLDVDIFRNSAIIGGKDAQSYALQDIYSPTLEDYSRGHQEDARTSAIEEFLFLVNSGEPIGSSSLESHALTSNIMSTVYESMASNKEITNEI